MELSLVDNPYSLALASGNGLGRYKMNLGADAEYLLDSGGKSLFLVLNALNGIGELLLVHLNINIESIGIVHSVYLYLIIGSIALLDENCLDL